MTPDMYGKIFIHFMVLIATCFVFPLLAVGIPAWLSPESIEHRARERAMPMAIVVRDDIPPAAQARDQRGTNFTPKVGVYSVALPL